MSAAEQITMAWEIVRFLCILAAFVLALRLFFPPPYHVRRLISRVRGWWPVSRSRRGSSWL